MQAIKELDELSSEQFRNDILPAAEPVVLRGFVKDWPIVAAGKQSPEAFCEYVSRFDRGYDVNTAFGAPSMGGRIFYNEDMSGLNCRMNQQKLSGSLNYLLEHQDDDPAPTLAIQSVVISRYFPGMQTENVISPGFVPDGIDPRLWLGTRATIAAHYDPSENIACCVAGHRRFTLLPPEQVSNLYAGPFELTPAGAIISMVDFDNPDYEIYPKFRQAEDAALTADLEPGDAIYIPYLWWHHVRSLDSVNALVNYWWASVDEARGHPQNALLHAMMTIKALPPAHRSAWHGLFEHFVFEANGKVAEHLPEVKRGIAGDLKPDALKKLRTALSRMLSRN